MAISFFGGQRGQVAGEDVAGLAVGVELDEVEHVAGAGAEADDAGGCSRGRRRCPRCTGGVTAVAVHDDGGEVHELAKGAPASAASAGAP
jgi:hypothetical protein